MLAHLHGRARLRQLLGFYRTLCSFDRPRTAPERSSDLPVCVERKKSGCRFLLRAEVANDFFTSLLRVSASFDQHGNSRASKRLEEKFAHSGPDNCDLC